MKIARTNKVVFFFLSLILTASLAVLAAPGQASATEWTGLKTSVKGGVTYKYRAGIDNGLTKTARAEITASKNIGKDNLTARAYVCDGNGKTIVASGQTKGSGKAAIAKVSYSKGSLSGFRGKGVFVAKYSDTHTMTSNLTTVVRSSPLYNDSLKYKKNDGGLTFGNLYDVDDMAKAPDLISVLSDDEQEGYIYMNDDFLYGYDGTVLPVYEQDGKTLIGTFTIGDK